MPQSARKKNIAKLKAAQACMRQAANDLEDLRNSMFTGQIQLQEQGLLTGNDLAIFKSCIEMCRNTTVALRSGVDDATPELSFALLATAKGIGLTALALTPPIADHTISAMIEEPAQRVIITCQLNEEQQPESRPDIAEAIRTGELALQAIDDIQNARIPTDRIEDDYTTVMREFGAALLAVDTPEGTKLNELRRAAYQDQDQDQEWPFGDIGRVQDRVEELLRELRAIDMAS